MWAEFELTLVFYLQALLQVDQFRARVIWLRLPTYQSRKEMLRTLAATFTSDQTQKKLEGFLERASRLATKRNMIAHSVGGVDHETEKPFFVSDATNKELGVSFLGSVQFDWANVENWEADIKKLQTDMMNWMEEFSATVESQPKLHRIERHD